MTNYMTIKACASAGRNAEAADAAKGLGATGLARPADHIGEDSGFWQRRAFDWGFLAARLERDGDHAKAAYCAAKIKLIETNH